MRVSLIRDSLSDCSLFMMTFIDYKITALKFMLLLLILTNPSSFNSSWTPQIILQKYLYGLALSRGEQRVFQLH